MGKSYSTALEVEQSHNSPAIDEKRSGAAKMRWLFRFVITVLGLAQIVAARDTVGPDARSYLEIARAILRHDWAMTVNAYWSALYPWLLAVILGIVKPSLRWEFPIAHALAVPALLACIAAFEFFWASLLRMREVATERFALLNPSIPAWQVWALGYSFFIWLTVSDLLTAINPDIWMTIMILLTAGLSIRIALAAGARRSLYVWFGVCLGVGYLVKAILFPMGLVFILMMIFISGRPIRTRKWCYALTLLIFIFISVPEIALLSHSKGRPTFSDTGKLAFAWYNYGLPLRNWQGTLYGSGTPLHPTRKVFDHPAVYEFNGPLRSSYPPWFDPSYWNEGLSPPFRSGMVAKHMLVQIAELGSILSHPTAWVVGIVLILAGSDLRETLKGIFIFWFLIVTSAIAFSLYCLTLVQSRYLVPWEILLWGAVIAGVRLKRSLAPWYRALTPIVCLTLVAAIAHLIYGESVHGFHNDARAEYATAEGLRQIGLQSGENVGAIGFDNDAYWAYLDRLSIVAEINTEETCLFWNEPPSMQNQILGKFMQAGAIAVVVNTGGGIRTTSRATPLDLGGCSRPGPGWRKLEGSPNHIYFLK